MAIEVGIPGSIDTNQNVGKMSILVKRGQNQRNSKKLNNRAAALLSARFNLPV
jgi:hypothetical protein